MKSLIVILCTIILGVYIYNGIMSDDEESIKSSTKSVMENQINNLKNVP